MRRERHEKSVIIPVRVMNGVLEFLYESKMPALRDGAVGEVTFAADALQDKRWIAPLSAEKIVSIVGDGAQSFPVALAVRPDEITEEHRVHLLGSRQWHDLNSVQFTPREGEDTLRPLMLHGRHWILARLTSPFKLHLRGEKSARLRGGACYIPALEASGQPPQAISLNQALTFVSTHFETGRQSHTGNAFHDVMLKWRDKFRLLDEVREILESENETSRWKENGLDVEEIHQRVLGGLFKAK